MTTNLTYLNPNFTFNGLQHTAVELPEFANQLIENGDDHEVNIGHFILQWLDDNETIIVNTSGSTGTPKAIKLSKKSMIASAKATGTFFKLGEGTSALLCLPVNYIAGKMMLVRAMVLGWNLHVVAPEKDALTQYDNEYDFAAMVPYQVFHTLDALYKVKKLIIGGGSVSRDLRDKLQNIDVEAFETYGMTETITHIAIKRLNGPAASESFSALPDVKFEVDTRGCLIINALKIVDGSIVTNDVVTLETPTSFKWLGRFDNVINSGGIKLYPEKIEAKLSSKINIPFIISSEKDEALGEQVILVLEHPNEEKLHFDNLFENLTAFEKPKHIYTVSKFPYTETGKVKRGAVVKLIRGYK